MTPMADASPPEEFKRLPLLSTTLQPTSPNTMSDHGSPSKKSPPPPQRSPDHSRGGPTVIHVSESGSSSSSGTRPRPPSPDSGKRPRVIHLSESDSSKNAKTPVPKDWVSKAAPPSCGASRRVSTSPASLNWTEVDTLRVPPKDTMATVTIQSPRKTDPDSSTNEQKQDSPAKIYLGRKTN